MVLINELTVEQINAALLHLQRSKDEVVGGNKGTTIQNISISNSGGGGGNNVDYSGTIKNLATNIEKNKTAIEKNASDIAKLKSDMTNIEKSVEDTLQGLVDNGISDLSFDPLTKQLTITTNDGDIYQAIIEQDIGYLSYDSATNKLILTTGNQSQEITLPYIKSSEKGSANGVATLDENGRVPYSQLPESAMEFLGQWDASTNTPHLEDGTGTNGDFYIVSVGGTVDFGTAQNPHIVTFTVNDRVVYEGDIAQWVRLPAGQVSSVNGQSGAVTLTASDIEYSAGVSIKAKIDANAVQADWNVSDTTSLAYIKNKPTIPASPVQSDWNVTDTTSLAYIKNKPSVAVLGNTAGCGLGTASAGSLTTAARSDHVHPLPSVLGGIAVNGGTCASYNEGIRINVANNNYATLNIGAAAGTTSGAGGFWIGTNCVTSAGKLYINYGTSNKNSYFCCCSDGTVFWYGNVCGVAEQTNRLNATYTNEFNFCIGDDNPIVWFNYRNGRTGAFDSTHLITDYYFANRNCTTSGVTLHAACLDGTATASLSSNYLSTYAANGSDNISSLKAVFATVPKSVGTAVRLQHGSHSMAFGWFLNGYACANAYGGWFVSDYNIPKFVGVSNGTWAECTIITSGTIGSQHVACADHATSADVGTLSWTSCGCGVYVSGCLVRAEFYQDEDKCIYWKLRCFAQVVNNRSNVANPRRTSVVGSFCCTSGSAENASFGLTFLVVCSSIACLYTGYGQSDSINFCCSSSSIKDRTNFKLLAIR